jgi:hypothetical protein
MPCGLQRYAKDLGAKCSRGEAGESVQELVNEGVDFVGDPIVSEKDGEEGAEYPQNPAKMQPVGVERGKLHGDVDEVCGAVADIGDEGEKEKRGNRGEDKSGAEVRPSECDPEENDDGESEIVEEATRLPKAEGGGEKISDRAEGRIGEGLGGSGVNGIHNEALLS